MIRSLAFVEKPEYYAGPAELTRIRSCGRKDSLMTLRYTGLLNNTDVQM